MEFTTEQIKQAYTSTMDSVNLVNGTKPEGMSTPEWSSVIARNKEHINIMLAKDYWTTEDLTPFHAAVA